MFMKLIVSAVIVATATGAMARDITVTFADGHKHQYLNTPESVTPEQIIDRASRDFPDRTLVNVDGGRPLPDEKFCSSTGCQIAVGLVAIVALGAVLRHIPATKAFPCVLPTDRAKDGSLCGARASSVRPGGR